VSAPASEHSEIQGRIALIVEREYQPDPERCVAAVIKLLTYTRPSERQARPSDHAVGDAAAGDDRPLGAGARPAQHDAASAFSGRQRGVEEDGRDEHVTTADD
jgi:hypothetical protein